MPVSKAMPSGDATAGFGIYVHWPFCLSKCPYCDFNSHVGRQVDQGRWRAALLKDIDHFAGRGSKQTVTSVFLGGGTPSLMEPAVVAAVMDRIALRWPVTPDLEVTLEANPTSNEAARFRAYRTAGVNRLSLGVQALDDRALVRLGRQHSQAEARAALTLAQAVFPRTSFDLIYARPGQTPEAWRRELAEALALASEHLSLYQLTLEEGTAFHRQALRGELTLPDEETATELYDVTQEMTDAAGLPAYEVSNHARPGAACRHNLTYWRSGEYVGVGPGAHGRLADDGGWLAIRQFRAPSAWLDAVERHGHGTLEAAGLSAADRVKEALIMGLRLTEGLRRDRFSAATGFSLASVLAQERLERLVGGGFLTFDERGLRATPAGRRVLNAVLAALVA